MPPENIIPYSVLLYCINIDIYMYGVLACLLCIRYRIGYGYILYIISWIDSKGLLQDEQI